MTEIDAGHETPDAARLLGFFHAIFSSENKKMQMPLFAVRGGSELKNKDFRGRDFTSFCETLPLFEVLNITEFFDSISTSLAFEQFQQAFVQRMCLPWMLPRLPLRGSTAAC